MTVRGPASLKTSWAQRHPAAGAAFSGASKRGASCDIRIGLLIIALVSVAPAAHSESLAQSPSAPSLVDEQSVNAGPDDPWVRINRPSYSFSLGLDHVIIGPIVHGYMRVTPRPVQNGLGNFLFNLREPRITLNALLQGRAKSAGRAASRFVVNSTLGIAGIFDLAGSWGLERQTADFGQTMGRYGISPGPYIYLPLIGPLDLRDGVGRIVDAASDPISLALGGLGTPFGAGRLTASAVDARAKIDPELRDLNAQATDPYVSVRSAYSQRRAFLVDEAKGTVEALPDFGPSPLAP